MADDQKDVAQEPVSGTEPVSPEGEKPEGAEQPSEQPLSPEIQELINKSVSDAVAKASDEAKRAIQSAKDKARNEVATAQQRAKFASDTLDRVKGKFGELDPEVQQALELEMLRGKVGQYETAEQEQARNQAMMAEAQAFHESLLAHLKELGIDAEDKRLDWASDEKGGFYKGLTRFNKSVATILKDDITNAKKKLEEDAKAKLAKERKEHGLDEVPTDVPVASAEKSEEQKLKDRYPTMK